MNSSLKSTIATAIAIVADVTAVAQAGPAVFLRGDSIDVATDQAVYRVSRRDSVAVPWLESDRIRQICGTPHWVDASGGRLYAWGDKGLCLAGPAGVRKILAFGSGAAGIVQRVEVDPLGRVAVQFRNGQWQTAQDTGGDFRSGAPDTVSRDGVVYSPGDGNYWRVQGNLLIHRKVDGRSDSVSLPSGMDVYALAQDSSGWVLVTDWMDLYGSRKGRWAKLSIPSGEAGSLRQILSDPAGGTWVLTQRSLYRFQDSSLVRFAQARPGSSPWNALAVDSSGVPWVVTEAGDLLHPQGDRWAEIRVSLRKPPDPKVRLWRHGMLPDLLEPVLVAIPGPHRRLWATSGPRILQWESDSLSLVKLPSGLDTSRVARISVMALSETDISIQTDALDQWRWNGADWKRETPVATFLGTGAMDASGASWMGTWDGQVWKDAGGTWKRVDSSETGRVFRGAVNDAMATPGGDIYFATDSGLVARIAGTWQLQAQTRKCWRIERDPDGLLLRGCGDLWAMGDGLNWSVPDTSSGKLYQAMFTAAGDSTMWFYRDGLKVWKKGRLVDFPILSSALPPEFRALKSLGDGRVAFMGPGFFAVREPFALDEVPVGIGGESARGPVRAFHARWRGGRLELSGLPSGIPIRIDRVGLDGRAWGRSLVVADASGRAGLDGMGGQAGTMILRVRPAGMAPWSTRVVAFP